MNKNYRTMLIAGIISLLASSGIFGLETPGKACFDTSKDCGLRKVVGTYILGNCALFGTIPFVSAGFIKIMGSGSLKDSRTSFKSINRDLAKGLLKTMPVTAAGAYAYTTLQNNIAQ